jgi:hypothetical protein
MAKIARAKSTAMARSVRLHDSVTGLMSSLLMALGSSSAFLALADIALDDRDPGAHRDGDPDAAARVALDVDAVQQ